MSYVFDTIKIELGEQEYEDRYSNILLHVIAKHYLKSEVKWSCSVMSDSLRPHGL